MSHHKTLPPSSFPALSLCACFSSENSKPREYSEIGTDKHVEFSKAISDLLSGRIHWGLSEKILNDESLNYAIENVINIYRKYYPAQDIKDCDYLIDSKIIIEDENLNEISFGAADLIINNILFDLKNGEVRDYRLQMLMYARGYMQAKGFNEMVVVEVYSKYYVVKEYKVTLKECIDETDKIIARVYNPNKKPNPNEYCKWCGKAGTCEPLVNAALAVVESLDVSDKSKLEKFDYKNIETPESIGFLLDLWKIVLKPFGESLEYKAKLMVQNGLIPTGYRTQKRAGLPVVKDLTELFKAANLDAKDFLDCCSITLGSLQKAMNIKSKDDFNMFVEPYISRGDDTIVLIKDKGK